MEHTKHIFRALLIPITLGIVFVFVRHFVIPESFGMHGPYRFSNVSEQMEKEVVHGGRGSCRACHEAQEGEHAGGLHAAVSCEVCHAPLSTHARGTEKIAAMPVDRSQTLCGWCHQKFQGRPVDFPQIVVEDHSAGRSCVDCHSAHNPKRFGSVAAGPNQAQRAAPVGGGACGNCHADQQGEHAVGKHASVSCQICHGPPTGHVEGSKKTAAMPVDRTANLCGRCHREGQDRPKGFPQVDLEKHAAGKACVDCHSAHSPRGRAGSGTRTASASGQGSVESCYQCHEKIRGALAEMRYLHAPVSQGQCTGCHSPPGPDHASSEPDRSVELCFRCHEAIENAMTTAVSVHEPSRENCANCHNPHGGQYRGMLAHPIAESLYNTFSIETYALCFSCHESSLATEQSTATATKFRDGENNLHFVHVLIEKKGRACKACHDPHAGKQESLIGPLVSPEMSWVIPLEFSRTQTGGTCVAGCHKELSYDRLNPVTYKD